ncbi:uncharacterized protein BP5553_07380 [Venustampulla echinocandica]|uniref:Centromere protein X n=1 Tax=Venustampulla echinocandica TaxID=2656787 RepID=A0A370TJB4_9HELO|nr:uncharacterized protein BP5553_07380 [Venustampulla echinocandica]RDL35449.1 hypothetical protein BP5553_07380 [Venustampulla echinocandica]
MPPKPFKPPRPSGRPRKSTSTTPASGTKRAASSVPKRKTKTGAGIEKIQGRRVSAREMGLPSLSPDSQPASHPSSAPASNPEDRDEGEDDTFAERTELRHGDGEGEGDADDGRQETIRPELLAVIVQQFFQEKGTRLGTGAKKAIGKYMETFVREGITRCVWARSEEMCGVEGASGILEVEDLEKLAPQLLMDF